MQSRGSRHGQSVGAGPPSRALGLHTPPPFVCFEGPGETGNQHVNIAPSPLQGPAPLTGETGNQLVNTTPSPLQGTPPHDRTTPSDSTNVTDGISTTNTLFIPDKHSIHPYRCTQNADESLMKLDSISLPASRAPHPTNLSEVVKRTGLVFIPKPMF